MRHKKYITGKIDDQQDFLDKIKEIEKTIEGHKKTLDSCNDKPHMDSMKMFLLERMIVEHKKLIKVRDNYIQWILYRSNNPVYGKLELVVDNTN